MLVDDFILKLVKELILRLLKIKIRYILEHSLC